MAASLKALSCAVLLLLVPPPHACMAATTTTLQDRCERYAGGDRSSYDYCVWTLQRAGASASTSADDRGLAAIAARAARATAKATGAKIAWLQANETVPARRDCLAACAAEYAAAVRRLGRAARDAARGGSALLQRAQTLLAEVTGTTARCDGALADAGQYSPLDGADHGLDDQIELAIALLPPPTTSSTT